MVTQTADRRRSIARALGWQCSWTGFPAGGPVNFGRAPGAHVVGIDSGALLLITQTEHGVTATGRAPEAWAPWTHIPHDIPSLCQRFAMHLGRTCLVSLWSHRHCHDVVACHVVTRTDDKRTSIEPVLPGCVPCSFIPEGGDDGVPVATITHELGSHVFQVVGGGVALVVTQTLQGVTTIGQAPPAVAVGTFESHGAAIPSVAGVGRPWHRCQRNAGKIPTDCGSDCRQENIHCNSSTWLCDGQVHSGDSDLAAAASLTKLVRIPSSRRRCGVLPHHSCSSHSSGWYFFSPHGRSVPTVSSPASPPSVPAPVGQAPGSHVMEGCCTEDRWLGH